MTDGTRPGVGATRFVPARDRFDVSWYVPDATVGGEVPMRFSVIICSFDGAAKVPALLESLESCAARTSCEVEFVLVDNNSSDATPELFRAFATRPGIRSICIRETVQGKGVALNHGIRASCGTHLVFTDDDVRVDPDWLENVRREFGADPELSGLGGRVEPFDPASLPVAVRTSRDRRWLDVHGFDVGNTPILGCNMAFRRDVVEDIGGFDPHFGPGSRIRATVEDVDLVYRLLRRGRRIVYSPDPVVYHDHGRNTVDDHRASRRAYVRGRGALYCKYLLRGDGIIARQAYREVVRSVTSRRARSVDGSTPHVRESDLSGLLGGAFAYLVRGRAGGATLEVPGAPGRRAEDPDG